MNDYRAILENHGARWEDTATLRAYEAQVLASQVYLRLAESAALRGRFNGDATSEQFWRMLEGDQQNEWGAPFDLRGHSAQNLLAPMLHL